MPSNRGPPSELADEKGMNWEPGHFGNAQGKRQNTVLNVRWSFKG